MAPGKIKRLARLRRYFADEDMRATLETMRDPTLIAALLVLSTRLAEIWEGEDEYVGKSTESALCELARAVHCGREPYVW